VRDIGAIKQQGGLPSA